MVSKPNLHIESVLCDKANKLGGFSYISGTLLSSVSFPLRRNDFVKMIREPWEGICRSIKLKFLLKLNKFQFKSGATSFLRGKVVLKIYRIVQLAFSTSVTFAGSDPAATSSTILTTCSVLGKPMVANLEWMRVPLTVTSKQVRRPTVPDMSACGTCSRMASAIST